MSTQRVKGEEMKSLLEDKREIIAIYLAGGHCYYQVGDVLHGKKIHRIECYGEPGHMVRIPWFAVYLEGEDEPRNRVNASMIENVHYKGTPPLIGGRNDY
jgi:hypothetical protein